MNENPEPEKTTPGAGEWRWVSLVKTGLGWVLGFLALAILALAVVSAIARRVS